MVVPILAAVLLTALPCPTPHPHKQYARCASASAKSSNIMQERALRRRVIWMARIAYLERREAGLSELLAQTRAASLEFRDSRIARFRGLEVGPTLVTADFLGSPIVRVTVTNRGSNAAGALLIAHLRDRDGRSADASEAVESLSPGESRSVEILCPNRFIPTSIDWSVVWL